jgi:hypothetical protein
MGTTALVPFTSQLPKAPTSAEASLTLCANALAVTVRDDTTYKTAGEMLRSLKDREKEILAWDKPIRDFFNREKSNYDAMVKTLTEPLKQGVGHLVDQIRRHDAWIEAENRRLREEAEAAARAEAERIAKEREAERLAAEAAAKETAMPWEDEEDVAPVEVSVPAPPPVPMPVPQMLKPVVAGLSMKNTPAKAEITDPAAVLAWVMQSPVDRIPEFITFNMPAFNQKAKVLGENIGNVIPGVVCVRNKTASIR